MAHGIHMVGCKPDLDQMVRIGLKIFRRRHSWFYLFGQYHDTGMAFAKADLIFRTDHPMALDSADPGDLEGYWFPFGGIDRRTRQRYDNLLARCDIRSAANDRQGFRAAGIHLRQF